jgi:VWFA-related protein
MKKALFVVQGLLLSLLVLPVFSQDRSDEIIRVETSLVNIPVIVSDRQNRYVPGLTAANFKVYQDGAEQKIEVFNNEDAPMNIVLVLDTSLSTESVLGKIKKAAREFVKVLDAGDRAMIASIDNNFEVLSELTSDKKQLDRAIKNAEIGNRVGTVIYDGLHEVIFGKLKNIKGRKAVIFLTDGMDFGSYMTERELLEELAESDTVIYPVFYETAGQRPPAPQRQPPFPGRGGVFGRGGVPGGRGGMGRGRGIPGRGGNRPRSGRPNADRMNERAREFLQKLAGNTGGRLFQQETDDLSDIFKQIADEMKRQYLIGYYPPEGSPAGTVHSIRVEVDRPNSVVRSKTSYRSVAK